MYCFNLDIALFLQVFNGRNQLFTPRVKRTIMEKIMSKMSLKVTNVDTTLRKPEDVLQGVRKISPEENCLPVRVRVWFRISVRIRAGGNFPRTVLQTVTSC